MLNIVFLCFWKKSLMLSKTAQIWSKYSKIVKYYYNVK